MAVVTYTKKLADKNCESRKMLKAERQVSYICIKADFFRHFFIHFHTNSQKHNGQCWLDLPFKLQIY